MKYRRNLFHDKTIIAAAATGVIAVSAIVGSILMNDGGVNDRNNTPIVDLSENGTISDNRWAERDTTSSNNTSINEEQTTKGEEGVAVSDQNGITAIQPEDAGQNDVKDTTNIDNDANVQSGEVGDSDQVSGIAGITFDAKSILVWPVEGNVIIDYDMENTVYFPTLDLYKCSDAVCIQSEVGTPVYAGSACVIEEIAYNSEIGNNVTVSMGNGYMLTYGQLKDVQVENGDVLEEGELIGYIGNPTKYYTLEGAHLYMKMTKGGEAVNPLDYLNYAE